MNKKSEILIKLLQKETGKKVLLKEFFATGPEYKFFGNLTTKERTYKDKVMTQTLQILFDINGVSEKSFSSLDDGKKRFQAWVDDHADEFDSVINKFKDNRRVEFCAEYCYDKFFKNNNILSDNSKPLQESKNLEDLKKNKIPLTDEERDEVMKSKAVWHHGQNGKPSPAVWKSKDKKGKITFVTNTHRAFNTASTLKGAISKYHSFIKGTA